GFAIGIMNREAVVQEPETSARRNARDHQIGQEARFRMCRAVPIADFVILRQLFLEREAVKRRPLSVDDGLLQETFTVRYNPIGAMGRLLLTDLIEFERRAERPGAEADIGDVRSLRKPHEQQHMAALNAARRLTDINARGQPGQIVAKRFQSGGEQTVLLEAIAAAFVPYQLLLERGGAKEDAPLQQHIEILEADCSGMKRVQRAQSLKRGLPGARIADAAQIRVDIDRV